jgi:hypothetical protein
MTKNENDDDNKNENDDDNNDEIFVVPIFLVHPREY